MSEINYTISLTGSNFFDSVIYMRAKDLTREYPGVTVTRNEDHTLTISGDLPGEGARRLHEELGCYHLGD